MRARNVSAMAKGEKEADLPQENGKRGAKNRLLRSLSVSQKLGLMAIALILPTLFLLGFSWYKLHEDVAFTALEQDGLEYYHPLEEIGRRLDDINVLTVDGLLRGVDVTVRRTELFAEAD